MTVIDLSRKKRHGRCSTCLWHWPEVHGGEGHRCYCQGSPKYHQETNGGCLEHERRYVEPTKCNKYKAVWGNPGTPYHRNKGVKDEKDE